MRSLPKRRRGDSLIGQVVVANVVLVTLTLVGATAVAGLDRSGSDSAGQLVVLVLLLILTFCVNLWMLQKRFGPLEHLIDRIEQVDPSASTSLQLGGDPVEEIDRLARSFNRLLERVDAERRRSSHLVLRAQEEERRRVARDLHDEVNQALTAMLLRLEALAQDVPPERRDDVAQLKRLTTQAMDELLNLARQLRPTALDDHGLVTAIEAQVRGFGDRTGIDARLETEGDPAALDDERQTVIYRIAQEALANAGRHAGASRVDVSLSAVGDGARLRVADDGAGFDPVARARRAGPGGHGRAGQARGWRARSAIGAGRRHRSHPEAAVISVLIADDHGIVRSGLSMLIDRQADMHVCSEAEDGIEAVEHTLAQRPDVAVLDVSMPRLTGLHAARQIRNQTPDVHVLMLSMHDDDAYFFEALEAGAAGYVSKRGADTDLIGAIRTVAEGRTFLNSRTQQTLMRQWLEDGRTSPAEDLTPREMEVVKLIAEAYTNKQIADALHLSEKTVESHRGNVLAKLGMRDRVELVRYAIRRGLVEP